MTKTESQEPNPFSRQVQESRDLIRSERIDFGPPPPPPAPVQYEPGFVPPKFSKTLTSVIVTEGEPVYFEGYVNGTPSPEISWQFNDKSIRPGIQTSYVDGKVTLNIPAARPEDSGKFMCAARNAGGFATSSAQLVVRRKKMKMNFYKTIQ